jgi:hypothetical protein
MNKKIIILIVVILIIGIIIGYFVLPMLSQPAGIGEEVFGTSSSVLPPNLP